jgi:N-glycosylase/DNA lyase
MKKSEIKKHYREKRKEIDSRLKEFKSLRDSSEERKFLELTFVLLTSRTDAEKAWEAANKLERSDLLLSGGTEDIGTILDEKGVQYPEKKAEFVVENREKLSQPTLVDPEKKLKISNRIDKEDLDSSRRWFAENLKGIGWKGASHFLRNIGYGNGFAIISGHIAGQLYELELKENPGPVDDEEEYLELEQRLQKLSEDLGIDIKALDLVLWSMKTGKVFR